ncbi:cortical protein marker for cell polarity-domain-containing protein [Biscogniauxia mediterranea]|nr:cortical protein marker for cell polarity-domain-containing protein [Biscogniauxia mediterranea]
MRIPFRSLSATRSCARTPTPWLFALTSLASISQAYSITSVPSPNLDLSKLGQVGIAGDFDGISYYQYEGQTEQPYSSNGTEQLMVRLPNGAFLNVLSADASIQAMCVFQGKVILGGNFTSLGGKESSGIASFDTNSSVVTPISGLSGQVNALLCDETAGKVYVGGNFKAGDSTNAITWLASNEWASLPFAGFNGPVTSVTKAASGHIIFGGSFTGLGNTSTLSEQDSQVINLSTADITAEQSTTTTGFSDPKNIVCKTDGQDGEGNTWLLQDNTPGAWKATFNFGFEPTKLRLWNTHQDGRGTKTWRYTALPLNGIMNFTYIDPATGQNLSCTSECPLSDDPDVEFQDFHFVNREIGMNSFRIDISAWYGSGGGLNGIQLLQNDIFSYAINDFNEPSCANTSTPATATVTGPFTVTQSGQSSSEYLSAVLASPIASDAASVVFYPDIKEAGNYTINLYTPGCIQDGTCSRRGQVDVYATLNSSNTRQRLGTTAIYQTNDYDKYDQFYGTFDAASGSFRPSITLTPVPGQQLQGSDMVMVAQKIGFELRNSTGGLNGLFEYDPSQTTVNTADFDTSAFIKLSTSFSTDSAVSSLATATDRIYIGGNFTSDDVRNIVAIDNNGQTVALGGGLNGEVLSMYLSDSQLFVGGNFDNTQANSASGLVNVAMYDSSSDNWTPLGAGVDGPVTGIVPMTLNFTGNTTENVVALTGRFTQLLAFDSNAATDAKGFAVWVKSQSNWLQNLDTPVPLLNGMLSTALLEGLDSGPLYAGSLSGQSLRAYGAVSASETLGNFPIKIQTPTTSSNSSTQSLSKRASVVNSTDTIAGVVTGAFDTNDDRNITILGGHFTATATNGSTIYNLALIDRSDSDSVSGLGTDLSADSVVLALATQGDNVFAGGRINGTINDSQVNGLLSYNLASRSPNTQPPALDGDSVVVSAISVRPSTSDIYVGGLFDTAGSLPCPTVCMFSTESSQWTRPGFELGGTVHAMMWTSNSVLVAGGELTINDTTTYLVSYDASSTTWTSFSGASAIPGPVDALTPANEKRDQIWVAGTQSDGSTYLMKYDGSSWASADITFDAGTLISSLQMFTVTESHDSSSIMDSDQVLLLTGTIGVPGFGTASGAIFNGTTLQPFALTSSFNNGTLGAGSISKIFVEKDNFFTSSTSSGMPVGFVVLISLAISLGLMLLIVAAGLALDRYRKKRDGYIPAPTSMYDRGSGMQRIPPHELLDSLNKGRPGAPHV